MIKYACFGMTIPSRTDSQFHFISAAKVAELYKVKRSECILINNERDEKTINVDNLIKLYPRYDGNYSL